MPHLNALVPRTYEGGQVVSGWAVVRRTSERLAGDDAGSVGKSPGGGVGLRATVPARRCRDGSRSAGEGRARAGRQGGAPRLSHALAQGGAPALHRDAPGLDAHAARDRQREERRRPGSARPDPAARVSPRRRGRFDCAAGVRLLPRRRLGDRRPEHPRCAVPTADGGLGRERGLGRLPPGAGAEVPGRRRRRVGGHEVGRRPRGRIGAGRHPAGGRRRQRRRQPGRGGGADGPRRRRPGHRPPDLDLPGHRRLAGDALVHRLRRRVHAHARQHALVHRPLLGVQGGRARLAGVTATGALAGRAAAGADHHCRLRSPARRGRGLRGAAARRRQHGRLRLLRRHGPRLHGHGQAARHHRARHRPRRRLAAAGVHAGSRTARGTRPATARTRRGAARQMASDDSPQQAMQIQNATA